MYSIIFSALRQLNLCKKAVPCRSRRTAFDESKKESRCLHLLSSFAQTLLASGRSHCSTGGGAVTPLNPLRRLDARTILEVLRGSGLHILGRPLAVGDRGTLALNREGHATPETSRVAGGRAGLARRHLLVAHLGNRLRKVASEVTGNLLDDLGLDLAEAGERQTIGGHRLVVRKYGRTKNLSLVLLLADQVSELDRHATPERSLVRLGTEW